MESILWWNGPSLPFPCETVRRRQPSSAATECLQICACSRCPELESFRIDFGAISVPLYKHVISRLTPFYRAELHLYKSHRKSIVLVVLRVLHSRSMSLPDFQNIIGSILWILLRRLCFRSPSLTDCHNQSHNIVLPGCDTSAQQSSKKDAYDA